MPCSYLNFSIQKIHQNSKRGCLYEYGANASKKVQKISTRTVMKSYQLNKRANFKATPMKEYRKQFITCFLEIQARFLFFPDN